MGKGGDVLRGAAEGHPTQALTGTSNTFTKLLDGQPYSALFPKHDKTSGSPPVAAAPQPHGQMAVPSANNFSMPTANMNNVAPLAVGAANQAVPLNAASNPGATQNIATGAMQQIQHPQFQNFVQDLMKNIGQPNQGAA